MPNEMFPTKGNLMIANSLLKLSQNGFQLLDKKRNVLIKEMMDLMEEARTIQSQIDEVFAEAYFALQQANIELGIQTIQQISYAVEEEKSVNIKSRSIMGVEIPLVSIEEESIKPQYGFTRTTISLDIAYEKFNKVKILTVRMAEVENAIYRLAMNMQRTQNRANALENVMITKYERITKEIQEELEEKDREEFCRLKRIKGR